ncbi:hypothetical protein BX600DRAFT_499009 [Xylariales sp. PMI_506]|nr:hypothetical protein BX600DRAFT_499009 [Xylariales sp. PMI_506]
MDPPILTIPVEILTRVFQACDGFLQVIAFASACKRTNAVWLDNSQSIIWNVARSQIRSFDDALMAVRATAIVLKAYQAGTLPPLVDPINSLSGTSQNPDLDELKEVLHMQHLVRCLEYRYFYGTTDGEFTMWQPEEDTEELMTLRYPAGRRRFPGCLKEDIPGAENATIDSFRDGFCRAMYRLFLAGAVFARAYMDPLFRARGEADLVTKNRFFTQWGSSDYWSYETDDLASQLGEDHSPEAVDLAYIRQSPVYNFDAPNGSEIGKWRDREYETYFGPLASWIIQDGRERQQIRPHHPNQTEPSWAQNPADIGAVRELMLLLVAYDHLNSHFIKNARVGYLQKQGNRSVTIIRFGEFQVEKITMPAAVEDVKDELLLAEDHPALVGTAGEAIPLQFEIFYPSWKLPLHSRSPIPRHRDHPAPSFQLEFWNFALRRYLNLTFKSGTFWFPKLDSLWWREVGRGEIFLNPNWAIVQNTEPQCMVANLCDYTRSFATLDDIQAASSSISSVCASYYALQVLTDMLDTEVTNYTNVNSGYDGVFSDYVDYVREMVPDALTLFMATATASAPNGGLGQQYFDCAYSSKSTSFTQACPISVSTPGQFTMSLHLTSCSKRNSRILIVRIISGKISSGRGTTFTMTYTLRDSDGFYAALSSQYSIGKSRVEFDTKNVVTRCGRGTTPCFETDITYVGVPTAVSGFTPTNPKDVITSALPQIGSMQDTITARQIDLATSTWPNGTDDVVEVLAMPVFMISQALQAMGSVKAIGEKEAKEMKINLILEILGIVFAFIPFLDELGPALEIADAGNVALAIQGIVADPSSAPMEILSALTLGKVKTSEDYAAVAAAKRAISDDNLSSIGAAFKAADDDLETTISHVCSID